MLKLNNLSISFGRNNSVFSRDSQLAVSDISFSVQPGEIVAVIGSSGAGKSLVAHALLGLLPQNASISGEIIFQGEHISARRINELRGREIALIPQSVSYLNPLIRVKKQAYRSARLSGRCHDTATASVNTAFSRYNLTKSIQSMFPFQISGGMARRVLTATATSGTANLIIADEPTAGLDPEVASRSLTHLRELADSGKGVILITHDLEKCTNIADTLVVLYRGETVEITPVEALLSENSPMHPYTKALWESLPQNGFVSKALPPEEPGKPDSTCCAFANRCSSANQMCLSHAPTLRQIDTKLVRCNCVTR